MTESENAPEVEGLTVVHGPMAAAGQLIYQINLQEGFILTNTPAEELGDSADSSMIATETGLISGRFATALIGTLPLASRAIRHIDPSDRIGA